MRIPGSNCRLKRRAVTLVEFMFVTAIFTFVTMFVVFVLIEVARQSRVTTREMPAQLTLYRSLDRTRSELMTANFRSVRIFDGGKRVEYQNPARGGTSRLEFVEADGQTSLVFDENIAVDGDSTWFSRLDGLFAATGEPTRFMITVTATAVDRKNRPLTISMGDLVTVRN